MISLLCSTKFKLVYESQRARPRLWAGGEWPCRKEGQGTTGEFLGTGVSIVLIVAVMAFFVQICVMTHLQYCIFILHQLFLYNAVNTNVLKYHMCKNVHSPVSRKSPKQETTHVPMNRERDFLKSC